MVKRELYKQSKVAIKMRVVSLVISQDSAHSIICRANMAFNLLNLTKILYRFDFVRFFPAKFRQFASKVSIRCGFAIDWAEQIKRFNYAFWYFYFIRFLLLLRQCL